MENEAGRVAWSRLRLHFETNDYGVAPMQGSVWFFFWTCYRIVQRSIALGFSPGPSSNLICVHTWNQLQSDKRMELGHGRRGGVWPKGPGSCRGGGILLRPADLHFDDLSDGTCKTGKGGKTCDGEKVGVGVEKLSTMTNFTEQITESVKKRALLKRKDSRKKMKDLTGRQWASRWRPGLCSSTEQSTIVLSGMRKLQGTSFLF